MYIPTSKDVKFKAKNAIDMFGGRFAKATGSGVALLALNAFILGPIISFSTIAIWIFSALYVGRSNAVLSESGKIVE